MAWKTMDAWRADDGPENGTELLVLCGDGERLVASYSGTGMCWQSKGRSFPHFHVVAWDNIPSVPDELLARISAVKSAREDADALYRSPLTLT